ncbi:MAG: gfo/Idh/MocA family oxidoreductase, partial [Lentisphaeria bacterium]|nr:gfo/Idh/MocA family oxidoreductase [Lentisphaeria bacterium]
RIVFENNKLMYKRHAVATSDHIKNSPNGFSSPDTWDCEIHFTPDNVGLPQHMRIVANVIDAIRNGAELKAPVEEGIRGLELSNAMMLSGFLKKPVELPLDSSIYAAKLQELIATSRYPKKVSTNKVANSDDFSKSF